MSNITGVTRTIPTAVGTVVSAYNEVSSVAISTTITINTYTVPLLKTASLQRIDVGGQNIALYEVFINSNKIARTRTYFGSGLTTSIDFTTASGQGLLLDPSDVLVVKVTNFRPTTADFESRIEIIELS